jgi:hypothetical protein
LVKCDIKFYNILKKFWKWDWRHNDGSIYATCAEFQITGGSGGGGGGDDGNIIPLLLSVVST